MMNVSRKKSVYMSACQREREKGGEEKKDVGACLHAHAEKDKG